MNGARLYELLAMEVDLRELRLSAIARPLEMDQIEGGMKSKVVNVEVSRNREHDVFSSISSQSKKPDNPVHLTLSI